MQKFTIRLPDDTVNGLNQTAEERGLSFADVVREGLNLYIKQNPCILSENFDEFRQFITASRIFFEDQNTRTRSEQEGTNEQ